MRLVEDDIEGTDVVLQLFCGPHTDQRTDDGGMQQRPCQRHLGRSRTQLFCHLDDDVGLCTT